MHPLLELKQNATYLFPDNGRHHAMLGASAAPRYTKCTISVSLIKEALESGEVIHKISESAVRGTIAHGLLEHCLTEKVDAETMLLEDITVDLDTEVDGDVVKKPTTVTIDSMSMVNEIQSVVEHLRNNRSEYDVMPEVQLDVSWINLEEGATGAGDVVGYNKEIKQVYIGDLKSGYIFVSPSSIQLKIYAAALACQFLEAGIEVDSILLEIYQPKHEDGFRTYTYSVDELIEDVKFVQGKARDIAEGNVEYKPCRKACMFCEVNPICKGKDEYLLDKVLEGFDGVPPRVREGEDFLDTSYIAWLVANKSKINKHISDVIEEASKTAEITGLIPQGLELKEVYGNQSWVDEKKVITKLKGLKFKKDDYIRQKLVGVEELRKVVGDEEKFDKFAPLINKPFKGTILSVLKKDTPKGGDSPEK